MKPRRLELKNWLKNTAIEIRELKNKHNETQRRCKSGGSIYFGDLQDKSYEYRHYHIAYSELRGKKREQIEKPREDNLPDEKFIEKIKVKYFDEQASIRAGA